MATTHYDPFRGDAVESEMKRPTQQFAKSVKGNEEAAIPPGYKHTEVGVIPESIGKSSTSAELTNPNVEGRGYTKPLGTLSIRAS